jgi:hypothetical protein
MTMALDLLIAGLLAVKDYVALHVVDMPGAGLKHPGAGLYRHGAGAQDDGG